MGVSAETAEKLLQTQVEFCPDPKTVGAKFTTTYDPTPNANFGSLNAGDMRLMVGGATMNGQFAKDLEKFGGQRAALYQDIHSYLFKTVAETQRLVEATEEALKADSNLSA